MKNKRHSFSFSTGPSTRLSMRLREHNLIPQAGVQDGLNALTVENPATEWSGELLDDRGEHIADVDGRSSALEVVASLLAKLSTRKFQ